MFRTWLAMLWLAGCAPAASGGDDTLDAGARDGSVASDAAPQCPGVCGTLPQCGCAGTQNCAVTNFSSGAAACIDTGASADFARCTGTGAGQCRRGSSCVDGVCDPVCATPADCPGAYRACNQPKNAQGSFIPGLSVCTQTCDPADPTASAGDFRPCGAGATCFPSPTHDSSCFGPVTVTGTQNQPCGTGDSSLCAAGFACVGAGASFHCQKFCHVGSDAQCTGTAAGLSCRAFASPQYAAALEIGFCN